MCSILCFFLISIGRFLSIKAFHCSELHIPFVLESQIQHLEISFHFGWILSNYSDSFGAMLALEDILGLLPHSVLQGTQIVVTLSFGVLTLGLEPKVPDCAELWCMDLCGFNHMMFMPSVHDADL